MQRNNQEKEDLCEGIFTRRKMALKVKELFQGAIGQGYSVLF